MNTPVTEATDRRRQPIWHEYAEDGTQTGRLISMQEAGEGGLHAAAHAVLWRPGGSEPEILLQRRSDKVATWPGHWEMSATGHIDAGTDKTPHAAALREVEEEVGINLPPESLLEIFRRRSDNSVNIGTHDVANMIRENELNIVHAARFPDDAELAYNDGEVDSSQWVPLSRYLEWTDAEDGAGEPLVPHDQEYVRQVANTVFYSMIFEELLAQDRERHPAAYAELDASLQKQREQEA